MSTEALVSRFQVLDGRRDADTQVSRSGLGSKNDVVRDYNLLLIVT